MPNKFEVVILAGGFGNRFRLHGGEVEKPLIEVFGSPQMIWALRGAVRSYPNARFYVASRSGLLENIQSTVKAYFPELIHEFVDIGESTLGPAQSLVNFIQNSKKLDLSAPLVACDNDCFNYLVPPENLNFVSVTSSSNPAHCFVLSNGDGNVIQLREKEILGETALSGNYGFISSNSFVELYKNTFFSKSEEFLSEVVSQALNQSNNFLSVGCIAYFSLGTPEEIGSLDAKILEFESE